MKTILSLAAVALLAGSASSQVLSEDFSSGVPPTGWVQTNNNAHIGVGWIPDGFGRAWCEDEAGVGTVDTTLLSPVFDLTGVSGATLTFDGETYHMWFVGTNSSEHLSIGYATSSDGITWDKEGSLPVLTDDSDWEYPDVDTPMVIDDGETIHMWYTGGWFDAVDPDSAAIGHATSTDGMAWERSASPVLSPDGTGFDGEDVLAPQVFVHEGDIKMLYAGGNGLGTQVQIGVALLESM